MKIDDFNIETFHSAVLTTNSAMTEYKLNWKPDYWVIVARMSVGSINIYPSASKTLQYYRIDKGTVVLPLHTDVLTIETVDATGFYDVYAVRNLDSFQVRD